MIRVVVDVNVLVAGLLAPGGVTAQILEAWRAGAFELIASRQLLREVARVSTKPWLEAIAPDLGLLLDLLAARGTLYLDPPPRSWVRDPDDDYLIELALVANARIVTGDLDLLEADLPVRVLTPRALLAELG